MNLNKVLFLGGDPSRFASVQIRCVDVAQSLGADHALKIKDLDQIPLRYEAFVCIKPTLSTAQITDLARRGMVIWDILDAIPPREGVQIYFASTENVRRQMSHLGRIEHIPHHHCNFAGRPNPANLRLPGWIGSRKWCPELRGLRFFKFYTQGESQARVVRAYRKIGIGLNFRLEPEWGEPKHPEQLHHDLHISINSGIKLINCIGFGVPSVSACEPAYCELGDAYTLFSTQADCWAQVKELRMNSDLYNALRRNCLLKARDYHLERITQRYAKFFKAL